MEDISSSKPWQHFRTSLNGAKEVSDTGMELVRSIEQHVDHLKHLLGVLPAAHPMKKNYLCRLLCSRGTSLQDELLGLFDKISKELQETLNLFASFPAEDHPSPKGGADSEAPSPFWVFQPEVAGFPLVGIPMDAFLGLSSLEPYPMLWKERKIETVPDEAAVHFVSHQWLSSKHPDPASVHLLRMQHFFRNLLLPGGFADIFRPEDWTSFAASFANHTDGEMHKTGKQFSRRRGSSEDNAKDLYINDIQSGYIWIDFISIPQFMPGMNEAEIDAVAENRLRAIKSIPTYVNRANYFYVLVPRARHENGSICNFSSWRNRGWCRAEEWASFLAPSKTMMPIVITERARVALLEFYDFLIFQASRREAGVFNGQFRCCQYKHLLPLSHHGRIKISCDKDALEMIMSKMYDEKLEKLAKHNKMLMWRSLKFIEPVFLAGSSSDRLSVTCSDKETIAEFLNRLRLPKAEQNTKALMYASWMGHSSMVSKLLKDGAPADEAFDGGTTPLLTATLANNAVSTVMTLIVEGGIGIEGINRTTRRGISPLDRAARGGRADIANMLLLARANVNIVRKDGFTPLLSAALIGHVDVCSLLLGSDAEVNAIANNGQGALHVAAHCFSPFGPPNAARVQVVEALLDARADLNLADSKGQVPTDIALREGYVEYIKLVMRYGRWPPHSIVQSKFFDLEDHIQITPKFQLQRQHAEEYNEDFEFNEFQFEEKDFKI